MHPTFFWKTFWQQTVSIIELFFFSSQNIRFVLYFAGTHHNVIVNRFSVWLCLFSQSFIIFFYWDSFGVWFRQIACSSLSGLLFLFGVVLFCLFRAVLVVADLALVWNWYMLFGCQRFGLVFGFKWVFEQPVVLMFVAWFSDFFQVCWDLHVSMHQGGLHSGTVLLSVAVLVIVFGVLLERALYLLLCSGGCWIVDLVTVLAVDPYTNLKPSFIRLTLSRHIFCNLVSSPYAGSLGCARDESWFCYDWLWYVLFTVLSQCIPFWVISESGPMPPALYLFSCMLFYFSFALKKKNYKSKKKED